MSKRLLRIYVSPTLVKPIAQKFREASIPVKDEGTSHIYVFVNTFGVDSYVYIKEVLYITHNTYFGLVPSDVTELPWQLDTTNVYRKYVEE